MLIDSHCHLTYEELSSQIDGVIQRARLHGIGEFVTIATDLADAEDALTLQRRFPQIHVAAGIHPHEAGKTQAGWDAELSKLAATDAIRGVGEMGLDYHYDFAARDCQHAVFRRQLEIATAAGKPVIIHCREAHADVLAVLADFPKVPRVVFHCFTGTEPEGREILDRGYWISLTGVVTFKRSEELRRVAKLIPDDRIMVETDSPYLSPEPVRSARPNEPSHLRYTATCIADVRGMAFEDFEGLTVANTRRFFGLPTPH